MDTLDSCLVNRPRETSYLWRVVVLLSGNNVLVEVFDSLDGAVAFVKNCFSTSIVLHAKIAICS